MWQKRLAGLAAVAVFAGAGAWVVRVGPVTAFRIAYHNRTGPDDYLRFPSRVLAPSGRPVALASSLWTGTDAEQELVGDLKDSRTRAFLVVVDGRIAFEHYGAGHGPTTLSQSFSMAKSVISILVGQAIEDGLLRSVDDPVTRYVPELHRRGFARVTIDDLLQMSSGSNYVENENPLGVHARFTYTPHLERELLRLTASDNDSGWRYKSGDTALLGLILSRAVAPRTLTDYMQTRLWSPGGMQSRAVWTVDHHRGLEKTWCCLAATARDYARIGLLYLTDGVADGTQVIPATWLARLESHDATQSVLDGHHRAMGVWSYKDHWWLVSPKEHDFLAAGHLGQYLYVHPGARTVIVRLGDDYGGRTQAQWIELFRSVARDWSEAHGA